jgi:hypothetical protein
MGPDRKTGYKKIEEERQAIRARIVDAKAGDFFSSALGGIPNFMDALARRNMSLADFHTFGDGMRDEGHEHILPSPVLVGMVVEIGSANDAYHAINAAKRFVRASDLNGLTGDVLRRLNELRGMVAGVQPVTPVSR